MSKTALFPTYARDPTATNQASAKLKPRVGREYRRTVLVPERGEEHVVGIVVDVVRNGSLVPDARNFGELLPEVGTLLVGDLSRLSERIAGVRTSEGASRRKREVKRTAGKLVIFLVMSTNMVASSFRPRVRSARAYRSKTSLRGRKRGDEVSVRAHPPQRTRSNAPNLIDMNLRCRELALDHLHTVQDQLSFLAPKIRPPPARAPPSSSSETRHCQSCHRDSRRTSPPSRANDRPSAFRSSRNRPTRTQCRGARREPEGASRLCRTNKRAGQQPLSRVANQRRATGLTLEGVLVVLIWENGGDASGEGVHGC
jgi:hypothetical protein